MSLEIIFTILLVLAMALAVLPGIPAVPLMAVLVIIYAAIDKFTTLEPWHLVIFIVLALLSLGVDFLSGLIGVKFGRGSKKTMLFGAIGLIIGLIVFPPFGALAGLFIGVFLGEILQAKDTTQALRTASFSFLGAAAGAVLNFIIAVSFFIAFLVIVI